MTCGAVVLQHCSKPQRQICSSCLLKIMYIVMVPAQMRLQPLQEMHLLLTGFTLPLLAW